MSTALQTLDFMGMPVSVIAHAGQNWLSAEQVGQCLGYDPLNARKGVLKLFERNKDEFGEADTGVVKLTTPGGVQSVRAFSATGCNKLGFFSQTRRAKDFRTWASRVLAGQAAVPAPEPQWQALAASMEMMAKGMELLLQKRDELTLAQEALAQSKTILAIATQALAPKAPRKPTRPITPEEVGRARSLKAQGLSQNEIARQLQRSTASVSWMVREEGAAA